MEKFKTQPNHLLGNELSINDELNKIWLSQYLNALKQDNIESNIEFEKLNTSGKNDVSIRFKKNSFGDIEITGNKGIDYQEMNDFGRSNRILFKLRDFKALLNEIKDESIFTDYIDYNIFFPNDSYANIVCKDDYFLLYYDDGCIGMELSDLVSIHFVWDQIIDFEL